MKQFISLERLIVNLMVFKIYRYDNDPELIYNWFEDAPISCEVYLEY